MLLIVFILLITQQLVYSDAENFPNSTSIPAPGELKASSSEFTVAKTLNEILLEPKWGEKVVKLILKLINIFTANPYPLQLKSFADKEYDYIVIGAGAAGSVVATRLSEDPNVKVLVLEAGGQETGFSMIPGVSDLLILSDLVWDFREKPQKNCSYGLKGQRIRTVVGKAIGGGSVHNTMMWVKGDPLDYDRWEQLGATGWSWAHMLPYYLKVETIQRRGTNPFDKGYHGLDGQMPISGVSEPSNVAQAIWEGIGELGLSRGDYNGARHDRFSPVPSNIKGGTRWSTARAYLAPASRRSNLDIVPYAFVRKILFDDSNKAVGVRYKKQGEIMDVKAKREVILSAGPVGSPKLLLLSGIGPKKQLERHGIPVRVDSPGVGENLQNHVATALYFTTKKNTTIVYTRANQLTEAASQYFHNRTGPLSRIVNGIQGFQRTKYALDERPDLSISFTNGLAGSFYTGFISDLITNHRKDVSDRYFGPQSLKDGFSAEINNFRPLSKGWVKLRSANPDDIPLINQRFLTAPNDIKTLIEGMKLALKITNTKAVQNELKATPFPNTLPGCEQYPIGSGGFFECHARTLTYSRHHYSSTCKMGSDTDAMAVVDPKLRVKGVKNLRVIDVSVIPEVTTSNTHVTTIMVGEKGADLIKGRALEAMLPPVNGLMSSLRYDQLSE